MQAVTGVGDGTRAGIFRTRPPSPVALAWFAIALAAALRLPSLAMLPPWGDEIITIKTISLPPLELLKERMHRMHAPTYYWFLQLLGMDERTPLFLLRLPSAIADSIGAGLTALVAYRLGGWRSALALAVLYACMPLMLEEAQDARPNGFFFGFLGLFLWSSTKLVDRPRLAAKAFARDAGQVARRLRWVWVGAAFGALGTVGMLALGLFAVAAVDLAMLWRGRRRGAWRRLLKPWFIQRLITVVLLSALFYGFLRYVGDFAGNYWVPDSFRRLLDTLEIIAGAGMEYDPDLFLGSRGNTVLLCLLLLFLSLGTTLAPRRSSLTIVLSLAFGSQAILIAVSQHTSLYVVRYFGVATPALTLLAALGLGLLWKRSRVAALSTGPVMIVLLFLQALDSMHHYNKPRFDLAVARLRDASVEEIGARVRDDFLFQNVLWHLRHEPRGTRISPWETFIWAQRGVSIWVIDYTWRPVRPHWAYWARYAGLQSCAVDVPGLSVLAIARRPEDLAASCGAAAVR